MSVAENISRHVTEKAINLSAMSRAIDVPYDTLYKSIGKKTHGQPRRPLRDEELIKVCKYLEKDIDDFWDEE